MPLPALAALVARIGSKVIAKAAIKKLGAAVVKKTAKGALVKSGRFTVKGFQGENSMFAANAYASGWNQFRKGGSLGDLSKGAKSGYFGAQRNTGKIAHNLQRASHNIFRASNRGGYPRSGTPRGKGSRFLLRSKYPNVNVSARYGGGSRGPSVKHSSSSTKAPKFSNVKYGNVKYGAGPKFSNIKYGNAPKHSNIKFGNAPKHSNFNFSNVTYSKNRR